MADPNNSAYYGKEYRIDSTRLKDFLADLIGRFRVAEKRDKDCSVCLNLDSRAPGGPSSAANIVGRPISVYLPVLDSSANLNPFNGKGPTYSDLYPPTKSIELIPSEGTVKIRVLDARTILNLDILNETAERYQSRLNDKENVLERLVEAGFPEELAVTLSSSLDQKIGRIVDGGIITLNSMAGVSGGGVGKVTIDDLAADQLPFSNEGRDYVFKIQSNKKAAYKDAVIPARIHERAKTDDLAARLAKRVAKPLFSEPIEMNGFYVTLAEDVSNKVVEYDELDTAILLRHVSQGLDSRILHQLYTAAMFHEVMNDIIDDNPDGRLEEKTLDTVLPDELIIARYGPRFKEVKARFKDRIGPRYKGWGQQLREHENEGTTFGIYDNTWKNYVGMDKRILVDFGLAKRGDEVEDIARSLMDRLEVCKSKGLLYAYVDSYVEMRRDLQHLFREGVVTYSPHRNEIKDLVAKQVELNTWRVGAWAAYTNRPEMFENMTNNAKAISSN